MHPRRLFFLLTAPFALALIGVAVNAIVSPQPTSAAPCDKLGTAKSLPGLSQGCQAAATAQGAFSTAKGAAKGAGDLAQGNPGKALIDVVTPATTGNDSDQGVSGLSGQTVKAANGMLQQVAGALNDLTTPDLTKGFYPGLFAKFFGLGMLATLPFLLLAIAESVLRSDWEQLRRSLAIYLPGAIFGAAAFCSIAQAFIQITDGISKELLQMTGPGLSNLLSATAASLAAIAVTPLGAIGAFVFAGAIFVAALLIWVELVARGAAIYLLVLFIPALFAISIWPRHKAMAGRGLQLGSALVLSKLVIVSALALAATMFTAPLAAIPQTAVMAITLLFLAIVSPATLYKLIPIAAERITAPGGSIPSGAASGMTTAAMATQGGTIAATGLRNLRRMQDPLSTTDTTEHGGASSHAPRGGFENTKQAALVRLGPNTLTPPEDESGSNQSGPGGSGGLQGGPNGPRTPPQLPPKPPDSRGSSGSGSDFGRQGS
jgi:hypothetical protein